MNDDRAGLQDTGAAPARSRQESILVAARFGQIQPAHNPERAVADHSSLDFACRLLSADQDDPQAPAAFRDIEQNFLDRAPAIPGRVLVQLIEHDEHKRPGRTGLLLIFEHPAKNDADHKPLGAVVKVVNINYGDLLLLPIDAVTIGFGNPSSNQMPDSKRSGAKPPFECRYGSLRR